MTLEELKAAGLTDEQAQKAFDLHTASVTKKLEEETTGLKKSRDEILAEKKKLQEQYKMYEGIDPEKAREALKKLADMDKKKMMDSGEYEKLLAAEKAQWEAEKAELIAKEEKAKGYITKTEVDRQLTEQFIKIGINDPDMLKAVKAMFQDSVNVSEVDGGYKVLHGEKTLEQSIKEFSETPAAKKFISAPVNAGGGSPGSAGGGTPANLDAQIKELMAKGKHGEAQAILSRAQLSKMHAPQ